MLTWGCHGADMQTSHEKEGADTLPFGLTAYLSVAGVPPPSLLGSH